MSEPIQIAIEATQYTRGYDPVLVQYSGKGVTKGPLAKTCFFHTTQTALNAIKPAHKTTWDDDEVDTLLLQELAESGITAVIAAPDLPPDTPEGTGVIKDTPKQS